MAITKTYLNFDVSPPLTLRLLLSIAVLFLVLLSSYHFGNVQAKESVKDPNLRIETVTKGPKSLTDMAFLNENEILVLEKNKGQVLRVVNENFSNNTVLSLKINNVKERGLLGIAIQNREQDDTKEKQETNSRYVFLFYTEASYKGNEKLSNSSCNPQECQEDEYSNRLYRYEYKDHRLINPKLLIDIPIYWNNRVYPDIYSNITNGGSDWHHYPILEGTHQGGKVVLDRHNNVFVVTGDGGGCFTQDGCYRSIKNGFLNAQTTNMIGGYKPTGMGGILHVTEKGTPVTNKGIIGNSDSLRSYYAYGIRNSFGLDFDHLTGNLWDTENGPHYGDEINLVKAGFNSGWAKIQGIFPVTNLRDLYVNSTEKGYPYSKYSARTDLDLEDFHGKGHYSDPEFTWNHSVGVTSMKFFDSNKLGNQYKNDLFVADTTGRIYHFDLTNDRTELRLSGLLGDKVANTDSELSEKIFAVGLGIITDLETGPDGYLYILSYSGKISRIIPKEFN